jgi:ribosomal-protein-alanine N-acetyltransferase
MGSQFKFNKKLLKLKVLDLNNYSKNYVKWMNDKNIRKYLSAAEGKYNNAKLKKYIISSLKNNNVLLFGIFYNNNHIGNIKINFDLNNHNCDIGYLIGEPFFLKKGIGTFCIKNIVLHLFQKYKIRIIYTEVLSKNLANIKLLRNIGFKKKYILKKRIWLKNKFEDIIGFEKINIKFLNKIYLKKINFKNKKYTVNF